MQQRKKWLTVDKIISHPIKIKVFAEVAMQFTAYAQGSTASDTQ